MKDDNKEEAIRFLQKNTQLDDVEKAYHLLADASQRAAAKCKRIKDDQARLRVEIELYLEDMKQITGLKYDSPLFWKLASLTLARKLRRIGLLRAEQGLRSPLTDGWPDEGGEGGLNGDW
jgi:hypothetical protein